MTTFRGLAVKKKIKLNQVQKAMAKSMKASVNELALSQLSRDLDLTAVQTLRREKFADHKPKISLNTIAMAAVARTLAKNPYLNAQLVDKEIIVFEPVNLGMAVSTPAGLIVTVIPDAEKLSLTDMAEKILDLGTRARSGKIGLADIEGGTFTVSNLGMFGVDAGVPIPRPPEAAILFLGAAKPRPVVLDGEIAIRTMCCTTLSYDHRFIDGAKGAEFLKDLYELLLTPEKLLA